MQPGSETIIISVDIQGNNQRLTDLRKELILNKQAVDELNKGFKDGRVSIDTLAEGQQKASVTAKQITGEIALLTKANAQQTVANQAGAGSLEQLRAQLALGSKAYNSLTQEERDNTVAGQKLQATNKGLSDQLKVLEKAVGDTRRNVGNYNEGIKDVNVVSGKLTDGLKSAVDKGLSPFKNQIEQGTGILGKFRSGSDLVTQGMGLLKGGGETGALGFKALAGGIALTGIGLFVIAISAVVAYFTESAEGAKQLAAIMGGLGTVLQVATDGVISLGKAIVYAVTHPLEAIRNLQATLTNALLHPIDTARGLSTAIGNITARTVEAGKAGAALVLEQKALIVARRELEIADVKEQSRVAVLLRLSKERGKSAADQLGALQEAGRLEAELTEKNIKLQEREAAAIRENIRQKGAGKAADLKAELGAKEKEIAQTLASQDETNARIQVRESVFREKQRTEAKANALTSRQDEVRDRQARLETALLSVIKGSAAELAVRKKLLEAARDLELAADKLTADQKQLIRAKSAVALKALDDEFVAKQVEAAKKEAEQAAKVVAARLTEAQREYVEAEKLLSDYLNEKRAALEQDYAAGKISENRYQKDLNAIDKAGNAAALVNAKEYGKATGALLKKQAEDEIKSANLVKDEKKRIERIKEGVTDTALQAGLVASDAIISALGQESAAGQAALAIKKTLALAEIGINLQRQLVANGLAGAKISESAAPATVPLGIAYTIVNDALAIASSAGAAAKILGFASGGYVAGAGTGTSDSIPAMLSNGESVMNANTTASFTPLLSYLNQLGGGVGFNAPASSAGRLNDGGMSARHAGAGLFPSAAEIGAAVAANVPTSIGVRDINVAQGRAARVRQLTKLG